MISIRFGQKRRLRWIMNFNCEHINRWFIPFVPRMSSIFWSLIPCPLCRMLSVVPLQISLLIVAACLVKTSCDVKRSEIADSSGGDELMLTGGLLILHAEKWISIQWHSGAVFYMMYILYCSTHCNFYRWTIKQRGEKCDWFIFWLYLFTVISVS